MMKKFKVALQLFGIREDMKQDMAAALKQVKAMGYDYVEFANLHGKTAKEVRSILDDVGLECVSVHQGPAVILEKGQEAIDDLKTLGAKFCAVPVYSLDKQKGSSEWDNTVKTFTEVGQLLKANGIQLLYHNHDFEFGKFEDKFLLDWIFETVPEITPEIDTCWVHYAGYNPADYLLKYAGKIDIVHLKDFVCKRFEKGPYYNLTAADGYVGTQEMRAENGLEFRPVGHGVQDFPAILAASEKAGAEYVVVEQDLTVDITPMEASKISREYLKSLGI